MKLRLHHRSAFGAALAALALAALVGPVRGETDPVRALQFSIGAGVTRPVLGSLEDWVAQEQAAGQFAAAGRDGRFGLASAWSASISTRLSPRWSLGVRGERCTGSHESIRFEPGQAFSTDLEHEIGEIAAEVIYWPSRPAGIHAGGRFGTAWGRVKFRASGERFNPFAASWTSGTWTSHAPAGALFAGWRSPGQTNPSFDLRAGWSFRDLGRGEDAEHMLRSAPANGPLLDRSGNPVSFDLSGPFVQIESGWAVDPSLWGRPGRASRDGEAAAAAGSPMAWAGAQWGQVTGDARGDGAVGVVAGGAFALVGPVHFTLGIESLAVPRHPSAIAMTLGPRIASTSGPVRPYLDGFTGVLLSGGSTLGGIELGVAAGAIADFGAPVGAFVEVRRYAWGNMEYSGSGLMVRAGPAFGGHVGAR